VGEETTRSTPPSLETSCQNTTSRKSTSMQSSNVSKASKKEEKVEAEKIKRRGEERASPVVGLQGTIAMNRP